MADDERPPDPQSAKSPDHKPRTGDDTPPREKPDDPKSFSFEDWAAI